MIDSRLTDTCERNFRVTYVARSFLDYRVPVLAELTRRTAGQFTFVTSDKFTPIRALKKVQDALGKNVVVLSGERSLGTDTPTEANTSICIPYQPGLLRTVKNTRPDVVVGDGFFQWTSAALWLRVRCGIPLVVCYERTSHTERHAQFYRRLYRKLALRWVDAICCSGSQCGDYTASLGFPKSRITYGHMAADTASWPARLAQISSHEAQALKLKYNLKGLVFLYVGRLIDNKGIRELLAAWTAVENTHIDQASLLLVGEGPDRGKYEQFCIDNELLNVRLVGMIDYDRLPIYYRIADAFIIPTLEDNWSLVVPEAMSCGLPVLCSKYNGCWPELVREGHNGWVFDPLSRQSLATALNRAIFHAGELRSMGEISRKIVSDHTAEHAANAILEACEIALTRRALNKEDNAVSFQSGR